MKRNRDWVDTQEDPVPKRRPTTIIPDVVEVLCDPDDVLEGGPMWTELYHGLSNAFPEHNRFNFKLPSELVDEFSSTDTVGEFCVVCEDGGELVLCDGVCARAFHWKCLKIPGEPKKSQRWLCPGCEGVLDECQWCNSCYLDPDLDVTQLERRIVVSTAESSFTVAGCGTRLLWNDSRMLLCTVNGCWRRFHPSCANMTLRTLKHEPPLRYTDWATFCSSFVCPAHVCSICDKPVNPSRPGYRDFAVCLRCPTVYHHHCLPNSVLLSECRNMILCPRHGLKESQWVAPPPNRHLPSFHMGVRNLECIAPMCPTNQTKHRGQVFKNIRFVRHRKGAVHTLCVTCHVSLEKNELCRLCYEPILAREESSPSAPTAPVDLLVSQPLVGETDLDPIYPVSSGHRLAPRPVADSDAVIRCRQCHRSAHVLCERATDSNFGRILEGWSEPFTGRRGLYTCTECSSGPISPQPDPSSSAPSRLASLHRALPPVSSKAFQEPSSTRSEAGGAAKKRCGDRSSEAGGAAKKKRCGDRSCDSAGALAVQTEPGKEIAKRRRSKRLGPLLLHDLSMGRERFPIAVINKYDDELPPPFYYVTASVEGKLTTERNVDKMVGCSCDGLCHPNRCLCMQSRVGYSSRQLLQDMYYSSPVYECNAKCGCGISCRNRVLQKGTCIPLAVFKTKDKGWAVRTRVPIKRGTFIGEYVGKKMDDKHAEDVGRIHGDAYLMELDIESFQQNPERSRNKVIDSTEFGNFTRFINHSCDANMIQQIVYVENQDIYLPRIGFYACKDVKAGEELSFDYMLKRNAWECRCGAASCRGKQTAKGDKEAAHSDSGAAKNGSTPPSPAKEAKEKESTPSSQGVNGRNVGDGGNGNGTGGSKAKASVADARAARTDTGSGSGSSNTTKQGGSAKSKSRDQSQSRSTAKPSTNGQSSASRTLRSTTDSSHTDSSQPQLPSGAASGGASREGEAASSTRSNVSNSSASQRPADPPRASRNTDQAQITKACPAVTAPDKKTPGSTADHNPPSRPAPTHTPRKNSSSKTTAALSSGAKGTSKKGPVASAQTLSPNCGPQAAKDSHTATRTTSNKTKLPRHEGSREDGDDERCEPLVFSAKNMEESKGAGGAHEAHTEKKKKKQKKEKKKKEKKVKKEKKRERERVKERERHTVIMAPATLPDTDGSDASVEVVAVKKAGDPPAVLVLE